MGRAAGGGGVLKRFRFGYNTRVGAEFGIERYQHLAVTVAQNDDSEWLVVLSPDVARNLAKQLKKAADMLDPPKPRKPRG